MARKWWPLTLVCVAAFIVHRPDRGAERKKIGTEDAQDLIDDATAVRESVGCGGA